MKKWIIGILSSLLVLALAFLGIMYFMGDKIIATAIEQQLKSIEKSAAPAGTSQGMSAEEQEKISEVISKIPPAEKVSAAAMVVTKLSPGDISELGKMVTDGISSEERSKIEKLVDEKFTPEEVKKLEDLYKKYLSEYINKK